MTKLDIIKMSDSLDLAESLIDLFGFQPAQSFTAKIFNRERGHYRTINNGSSDRCLIRIIGCAKISNKAASKSIARACWIKNVFAGICRDRKIGSVAKHCRAIFTAFYD